MKVHEKKWKEKKGTERNNIDRWKSFENMKRMTSNFDETGSMKECNHCKEVD
jgi:hypothetical protein